MEKHIILVVLLSITISSYAKQQPQSNVTNPSTFITTWRTTKVNNSILHRINLEPTTKKDDHSYIKSLFALSPISVFDYTTEGLLLSEKKDLLKKGESTSWKISIESNTKLTIQCKTPSSEVSFIFLKNKDNLYGVLFTMVQNEQVDNLFSWDYIHKDKTLLKKNINDLIKNYTVNDFLSNEDKLPDSYLAPISYIFIDDQTIEVSV